MHFINYIDLQTNEVTHREKKKSSFSPSLLPSQHSGHFSKNLQSLKFAFMDQFIFPGLGT